MTLRDTATGDSLAVAERLGSQDRAVGELLLARVARLDDQNQIVGVPVEIPLRLRDSALALVDSHPDADALARWYGEAIAFPTLVNREGEPLVLCHTELATDHGLRRRFEPEQGADTARIEPSGPQWRRSATASRATPAAVMAGNNRTTWPDPSDS